MKLNPFRGLLLDIEGTTSSIDFVFQTMFPYVREQLGDYLQQNWNRNSLQPTLDQLAQDLGLVNFDAWLGLKTISEQQAAVAAAVHQLMDDDVKATGLKRLQGEIWESGFRSGSMVAHVYDDVPDSLRNWYDQGIDIRIYSSGSIAAQKLFFGHTVAGDLTTFFNGHYDTTIGSKRESASYQRIAAEFNFPVQKIVFISDIPAELQAAAQAGMQVVLAIRPGNHFAHSNEQTVSFPCIDSFAELPNLIDWANGS